jgi:hypothetical protein
MKVAVFVEALDRRYLRALALRGDQQTGSHKLVVEKYGAGATHTVLAAKVSAVEAEPIAQRVGKCRSRLDVDPLVGPVHPEGQTQASHATLFATSSSARTNRTSTWSRL